MTSNRFMSAAEEYQNDRFEGVEDRLDVMQAAVDQNQLDLSEWERDLDEAYVRIGELEAHVYQLEVDLAEVLLGRAPPVRGQKEIDASRDRLDRLDRLESYICNIAQVLKSVVHVQSKMLNDAAEAKGWHGGPQTLGDGA